MKTSPRGTILAAGAPFAAVLLGLYLAKSAWLAIVLYHAAIVVATGKSEWRETMRQSSSACWNAATLPAVSIAALGGLLLYVLWPRLDATPSGLGKRLAEFGLHGASWYVFAVYYVTVHPVLEEQFWRGRLGAGGNAPDWRDVAFAGYHVLVLRVFITPAWVLACFAALLIASWTWRLLARRFGGLGVSIISHAFADASIITAAALLR
jgi:hypothetical protein